MNETGYEAKKSYSNLLKLKNELLILVINA